jgi:hypothetical protein
MQSGAEIWALGFQPTECERKKIQPIPNPISLSLILFADP